jgi:hypothetical protein
MLKVSCACTNRALAFVTFCDHCYTTITKKDSFIEVGIKLNGKLGVLLQSVERICIKLNVYCVTYFSLNQILEEAFVCM